MPQSIPKRLESRAIVKYVRHGILVDLPLARKQRLTYSSAGLAELKVRFNPAPFRKIDEQHLKHLQRRSEARAEQLKCE